MAERRCGSSRLSAEIDECLLALAREATPVQTVTRAAPVMRRFSDFVGASSKLERLADVTPEVAMQFIHSRLECGLQPSLATQHERRATVRLLFRVARRVGIAIGDPTLDLKLPVRATKSARPLVDSEIEVARDVALWSLSSRRMAAAWALAEATGRGAELSNVRPEDLDLSAGRVWLHGGKRTVDRWGQLTVWGTRVLRKRVTEMGSQTSVAYAGEGPGSAGQVSTCQAISTILVRAGLAGEPDVRPGSVAAWAGRSRFDAGAGIAEVAQVLGVRSLDQAAQIIGWDWTA